MKILILSDLHLNAPKGVLKRFVTEDPLAAIESLKQIIAAEKPEACIIAGDIFNGTKQDDTELHLLRKLKDALAGLLVYVIRGNHDRAEHSIPTDMFDWVELKETPVYLNAEKKITISGLHFCNTEKQMHMIGHDYIRIYFYIRIKIRKAFQLFLHNSSIIKQSNTRTIKQNIFFVRRDNFT